MDPYQLISVIASAGGGGSSGGGDGGAGILVLPLVVGAMVVAWWRRRKKIKKAAQDIKIAESTDPSWNVALDRAKEVFTEFQRDWSDFNVDSMRKYLSPHYFEHISLMLEVLKQMKRQNKMSDLNMTSAVLYNVSDKTVNDQDNFDVEFKATADDRLIDLTTDETIFVDTHGINELWHFDRQGHKWMLEWINQPGSLTSIAEGYIDEESKNQDEIDAAKMLAFATENKFFYNADFGWLMLPIEGVLFGRSKFGNSDVNYHVLGKYRGLNVQFYQYIPDVANRHTLWDYFKSLYKPEYRSNLYIIAQTILPKTYGNILVRQKNLYNISATPIGMKRIKFEGVDFNKFYNVYASDLEKVTSLELLHPAYMERLIALPFSVSIEIIGNVLYLYSGDKNADFNTMLDLLEEAFEEMKL